jgi:hypothetical protein
MAGIDINGTYFTEADQAEAWNLFHLARVAGKETRYERFLWASDEYAKTRTDCPAIRVYKMFDRTENKWGK